jgi:hypothetical protein
MMSIQLRLLLGAVAVLAFAGLAQGAVHKAVQQHCVTDYKKFCHEYGLETSALRHCMHKHGDRLNSACIAALVQAGEVTQAAVDKRKKDLGR